MPPASAIRPAEAQSGATPDAVDRVAKPRLPRPAEIPTQEGPHGLRFDFNDGCRVMLPDNGRAWRVRLSDLETGNVLFDIDLRSGHVNSTKRYFVPFRLEVWSQGEFLLGHDYDASEREVLIQFPVGTIGDVIGWMSYAAKFNELHRCRLTCALGEPLIPLFSAAYPDIAFVTHNSVRVERYYATYSVALFFDDADLVYQPCDFRQVGLHRTAAHILGVDTAERPPRVALSEDSRPIADPYVCIAVQATTQCKQWNNPDGWQSIVAFLKATGYRVICIDQKAESNHGDFRTRIPADAEDQTGDRPLPERARWLRHAAFFVGLSSGLSWLAWAVGTPVVLISGFTHPTNEFATPYRIINHHACNSCWNDVRHRFEHEDALWCPRLKGTPRQFECTRLITANHVETTLRSIPGFGNGVRPRSPPRASTVPTGQLTARDAPQGGAPLHALTANPPPPDAAGDAPLAIGALLTRPHGDVFRGGLAVGVTVGAGKLLDQAASEIAEGDRTVGAGDLAAALQNYKQSIAIVRHLTEADPDNAGFQRNLSVALNRIGAVLFVQRNLEGAQAAYSASLAIAQRLNTAHPTNVSFQRDLALYHALLADVVAAQGRHAEAFEHRRSNAALITQLANAAPTDPVLQKALATSYQNLGDAFVPTGNVDGALAVYQVSLSLTKRGLEASGQDPVWNQLYNTLLQKIRTAMLVQRRGTTPS
ncbi:autotransporter strand-loop-strand O-heptosyltransferase [Bradyrhizobium ontarionense]|uniref:Autotransporter strand-loop-strand O-heptosyltransferase n=1 Tax=Bradyrhizobium ontarionense TaxID=2898149 RepID=A0ABY3RGQ7_9BRAD|nr:autotransporter strand-loop-strand O-heptosyltransferase [Bradyrhizobium sp. A19]UFZ05849.1 autotransporter strand-loop-strand O-heptosyltransferase [Bradyrhizobium sp. A19]